MDNQQRKSNKFKIWLFEKDNKINKPLGRIIKRKERPPKLQLWILEMSNRPSENIINNYKLNNLDQMNKFLQSTNYQSHSRKKQTNK